jgi:hypothetical protein
MYFLLLLLPALAWAQSCNVTVVNTDDLNSKQPLLTPDQSPIGTKSTRWVSITPRNSINPNDVEFEVENDGVASVSDEHSYRCFMATTPQSRCRIQSKVAVPYIPGTSIDGKFSLVFSTSNADPETVLGAGMSSDTDFYGFIYYNSSFSIADFTQGELATARLTVTTAAESGSIQLTLAGEATFTIPLSDPTAGIEAESNAIDIARYIQINSLLYYAQQVGNSVEFLADTAFDTTTPEFSVAPGSAPGFAADLEVQTNGKITTETVIPESEFNGVDLSQYDPTLLNNYRIIFGGGGNVQFYIYNGPETKWDLMHTIFNTNKFTRAQTTNPSFAFRMVAINSAQPVRAASTEVYVDATAISMDSVGPQVALKKSFSGFNTFVLTAKNVEVPVYTIRSPRMFDGMQNNEILGVRQIDASADEASIVVNIYKNCVLENPIWQYKERSVSIAIEDFLATSCTGVEPISTFSVAKESSTIIPIIGLDLILLANETLTITALKTKNDDVTISSSIQWNQSN